MDIIVIDSVFDITPRIAQKATDQQLYDWSFLLASWMNLADAGSRMHSEAQRLYDLVEYEIMSRNPGEDLASDACSCQEGADGQEQGTEHYHEENQA